MPANIGSGIVCCQQSQRCKAHGYLSTSCNRHLRKDAVNHHAASVSACPCRRDASVCNLLVRRGYIRWIEHLQLCNFSTRP